jgi:hypothetical protein
MREVDQEWIEFANEVLNAAKRELGTKRIGKNPRYGVATRTLQRSLAFKFRYGKTGVQEIQLYAKGKASQYASYVHWGVNGNQVRHGSPFSYRSKQPPTQAVREWMRVKPVRLRDPKTGAYIKQTEAKLNSAAFLIARSIKRKGIPGVRYLVNGFDVAFRKKGNELAEAIGMEFAKKLVAKANSITMTLNA